jgi:endonuclease-3 related protein
MNPYVRIYRFLYDTYGPQGWWPLIDFEGENPTQTGIIHGYHPLRYDLPRTREEIFEICAGAILTQNVSWANVEKALLSLRSLRSLSPEGILALDSDLLKDAIRPAGYYNVKSRKLREFAVFYLSLAGQIPSRGDLLQVWGIGPETADSMLLYAYRVPVFVIDAYTRKVFGNLGLIDRDAGYDTIRAIFEGNIPRDFIIFQEYHALIVEHAKRFYGRSCDPALDPLYQHLRK